MNFFGTVPNWLPPGMGPSWLPGGSINGFGGPMTIPGMGPGMTPGMSPSMSPAMAGMGAPQNAQPPENGLRGLLKDPNLALALLANSGPSMEPKSFGQIFGQSALQANQITQQKQQQDIENRIAQARLDAAMHPARKPIAVLGPDGKPVLVDEQDAVGKTPYAGGAESRPSAFIQAYDRYLQGGGKLDMMSFAKQFAANNAQYPYQVGDRGGVPSLFPRTNPNVPGGPLPVVPLSTLPTEVTGKQALAAAGASGTTMGDKTATAAFDLPRVEQNVQQAVSEIKKLRDHPGLGRITGWSSKLPIFPGTDQAAADALAKQVQGQTFLQAYQQLRGGGAITEVEGAKGEAAVARLVRSQSTEDYQSALDDLVKILQDGLDRTRKQIGGGAPNTQKKETAAERAKRLGL